MKNGIGQESSIYKLSVSLNIKLINVILKLFTNLYQVVVKFVLELGGRD